MHQTSIASYFIFEFGNIKGVTLRVTVKNFIMDILPKQIKCLETSYLLFMHYETTKLNLAATT